MRERSFRAAAATATVPVLAVILLSPAEAKDEVVRSEKAAFRVETVVDGLDHPWGFVRLPDGRLLITERPGRLRAFADGRLSKPIQGTPEVFARGQGGLLDIELPPDHAATGWIYLAYSAVENGKSHTRIMRARFQDGRLTDQEIVFSPPVHEFTGSGIHFGCRMEFDDAGHVFFSIGERGNMHQAQDLKTAGGKIHRIRMDGSIPPDNPFVDTRGAMPSIWCYGNRNAQGLCLDEATGVLWEVEHGPRGGDELNIIRKGANYGWPVITYGIDYSGRPISDLTAKEGMEQPVIHWTPSIAVGGLDVYRGDAFPQWKGNLFATALAHQKLVRMEIDDKKVTHQEMLLERSGRIRDVRVLEDGLVYVVYDEPGKIVRLVPAS